MIEKIFGWMVLMILTGIATARLYGLIDPLLPIGNSHAMLSCMFVVVTWSSLTWSLRRFASVSLLDLFPAFWW